MLKKSLLSTAVLISTVLFAGTYSSNAQAGYKHHYRHAGYYDYHHYRPYRRGHRYPRHYRHKSNRGAYLVGGIALGAILSHAYHAPRYRGGVATHHDGYVVREVRRPPVIVREESRITRSLFRDRDGNCFERRREGGDELLIELPASECAW